MVSLDVGSFSNVPKAAIEKEIGNLLLSAGHTRPLKAILSTGNHSPSILPYNSVEVREVSNELGNFAVVLSVLIKESSTVWIILLKPRGPAIVEKAQELMTSLKKEAQLVSARREVEVMRRQLTQRVRDAAEAVDAENEEKQRRIEEIQALKSQLEKNTQENRRMKRRQSVLEGQLATSHAERNLLAQKLQKQGEDLDNCKRLLASFSRQRRKPLMRSLITMQK